MGLDIQSFINERFTPRITGHPVPQLKKWFPKGQKPVWKIRSINASEMGRATEAVANDGMTKQILEAVTAMNSPEVAEKIKELAGKSGEKPKDIARRMYHLCYGSIDPVCDLELADKLHATFPVLFYDLTNQILQLSGQGFEPGKSKPSGGTKGSK